MKKRAPKSQEKAKRRAESMRSGEARLDKYERALNGDIRALIEVSVERGINTKEDFPSYFIPSNARATTRL